MTKKHDKKRKASHRSASRGSIGKNFVNLVSPHPNFVTSNYDWLCVRVCGASHDTSSTNHNNNNNNNNKNNNNRNNCNNSSDNRNKGAARTREQETKRPR
jgi:hypothetical protein